MAFLKDLVLKVQSMSQNYNLCLAEEVYVPCIPTLTLFFQYQIFE